jgi:hypothetical protein
MTRDRNRDKIQSIQSWGTNKYREGNKQIMAESNNIDVRDKGRQVCVMQGSLGVDT